MEAGVDPTDPGVVLFLGVLVREGGVPAPEYTPSPLSLRCLLRPASSAIVRCLGEPRSLELALCVDRQPLSSSAVAGECGGEGEGEGLRE